MTVLPMTLSSATNPPTQVRAAAEHLVALLAQDDAFSSWVAQTVIDRAIQSGELVPAERLQFSGGLELVQAGRVAALEAAVETALAHLGAKPDVVAARDALAALATIDGPPKKGRKAAAKKAAAKKVPAKKAAAKRRTTKPDESTTEVEPTGRPEGMPVAGQTYACEACGEDVDGAQARMPWIRFRKILCQSDFQKQAHPDD